ncbi:hypothetical protein GALMADRAFT_127088 [Galerina marginata CBS 339.88]|uniref:Protein F37C4.5 n=1 Tax=Galerina marginata (strain CBS 339.88) TaxID=685588 RepID=A0A067SNI4_GALM3|nr:hypothetical protein GALMADRAFT_127088 [Galerina marginata CBS 339.88]
MDLDPVHTLSLNSIHDSAITNINLYTDRAQVTRSYKVKVAAGQTNLTISSLPNVVDHESLRVEGRGPAIIQGVTISKTPKQQADKTSPLLQELNDNKFRLQGTLERCKKALHAIESYMGKISMEHLDISKLGDAMDVYDTTEEKWDNKILEVSKEISAINTQIEKETKRLQENVPNNKLRTQVAMGLFATETAELQVNLIYAVNHASWEASYDIRVDMQTSDAPVKVVYKAAISQQTGEVWDNAPITLETTQPTFGLDLPELGDWNITHTKPPQAEHWRRSVGGKAPRKAMADPEDLDYFEANTTFVTSTGHINATFRVPGLSTIPSNEKGHLVTVADLELPAKMSWVCVPKGDTRVHLEANITNISEYTFLAGESNIYVDQSFIARTEVPSVRPREVFRFQLGIDPSIRLTYHPQTKLVSETGFYSKSFKYTYSQRITVHNTKAIDIEGLRITDHIPLSQDANLVVSLVNPALTIPAAGPSTVGFSGRMLAPPEPVQVMDGVIAQWNGADQPGYDISALALNGQFDWVCKVPAQQKINLVLQWEVTTSQRTEIYGL